MIQRLQQKRNEEGFTLIELLIVIIVLGILAAIVVFAVGSTKDDAVASACKTTVKSVELSAEAVNTHEGDYPATDVNALNAGNTNLLAGGTNGALLKEWPTSNDYVLQYHPTASGYEVRVFADGVYVHPSSGAIQVSATDTALPPVASCTSGL